MTGQETEIERLRAFYISKTGALDDEITSLRERVRDAETGLSTWDVGRNSEYWLRYPTRVASVR